MESIGERALDISNGSHHLINLSVYCTFAQFGSWEADAVSAKMLDVKKRLEKRKLVLRRFIC